MATRLLVLVCAALCYIVPYIDAACVCNAKGTDYCRSGDCAGGPIIPKPKTKYYASGIDLPPIGDNCWCRKLLVEPAALPPPAPCPKHKTPYCGCNKLPPPPPPCASYAAPSYAPPPLPPGPYLAGAPKEFSLPADAVSVSLALKAGKAIEVPEAKLAYGFAQKPVDALEKVHYSDVPEENLYKLKNDVITLQKRPPLVEEKEEEEILEEEEEQLPADYDEVPLLTYRQLGYVPEQFKNPKFRAVPSSYVVINNDRPCSGLHRAPACGYKSRRISSYRPLAVKNNNIDYYAAEASY